MSRLRGNQERRRGASIASRDLKDRDVFTWPGDGWHEGDVRRGSRAKERCSRRRRIPRPRCTSQEQGG